MSFFDEGDEPTRVTRPARPRRPATGSRPATGGGSGGPPGRGVDPQTLRVRQAVAAGVGLLVLILLVVGFKSCASSRKERALKDYNRNVTAVVADSNDQVSKPFFDLLRGTGTNASGDLQVQVNQLRLVADEDVRRTGGFDVPGQMKSAQSALTLVLNLRAAGLEKIAKDLPSAQSKGTGATANSEQAVRRIAGQMQAFLASDVVYSQRVIPNIKQALDGEQIGGQTIATSKFLPSLTWLAPQTVADALGASTSGGASKTARGPGPHGHGLTSVAVGSTALQPSPATNRVKVGAGLAIDVKFQNQGASDETDVRVTATITGGPKKISVGRTIDQTKAGSPAEVSLPLTTQPALGTPVSLEVTVKPVPGEQKTDNNTQRYTVIFTR